MSLFLCKKQSLTSCHHYHDKLFNLVPFIATLRDFCCNQIRNWGLQSQGKLLFLWALGQFLLIFKAFVGIVHPKITWNNVFNLYWVTILKNTCQINFIFPKAFRTLKYFNDLDSCLLVLVKFSSLWRHKLNFTERAQSMSVHRGIVRI